MSENVYQVVPRFASPSLRLRGNGYVTLGNPDILSGLTSYTISAWVNLSTLSGEQSVLAKLDVDESAGFHLYVQDGYPVAYYPSGGRVLLGTKRLTQNVWHHLACSYDHDSGKMTLYIDGLEDKSGTFPATSFDNDQDVLVGSAVISGDMQWYLQGMIGSVMIWGTCRTPSQVLNDSVRTTVASALAEPDLLTFLDVPYLPTADHSGNNLKTVQFKNGVDYCLCVPGVQLSSDAYVNVGNSSDLSFPNTDAYTIEGWVQPKAGAGVIVSRASSPTSGEYEIRYTADGRFEAYRGANDLLIRTEPNVIESGQHYHVAVTYAPPDSTLDATGNGILSLYVNGGVHATSYAPGDVTATGSQDVLIGARMNGSGQPEAFFEGTVQNMRFWKRALAANEISQWMNNDPVDGGDLAASFDFSVQPPHDTTDRHDVTLENGAHVDYAMMPFDTTDVLAKLGRLEAQNAVYFNQNKDPLNPTPPGPSAEELEARAKETHELLSDDHKEALWAGVESLLQDGTTLTAAMDDDAKEAWRSTLRDRFEDEFEEAKRRFDENPDLMKVFSTVESKGITQLIHHGPRGDEVILEYASDTISDCTLWWIQFIFKITVGFLQALGLAPKTGDIAKKIYNLVTANQTAMRAINSLIGKTITATAALGVVDVLYQQSLIWPIIKFVLVSAGWWTLAWVLKQIIAILTGLEAAAILADFTVWAIQLTKLALDFNSSCSNKAQYDLEPTAAIA